MKYSFPIFYLGVIGNSFQSLPCWHNPKLHVQFLKDEEDLSLLNPDLDFIFISTPVIWDQDGIFHKDTLHTKIQHLQTTFYHKIILTSIMPIGVAEELQCHYCPLTLYNEKRLFGCNPNLPIDEHLLFSCVTTLLDRYECLSIKNAEIKCLITLSQCWINQSFQKEISIFCAKNNIILPFTQTPATILRKELIPILTYIIRQIEDTRFDCPLLYSCLFRHHYIDIPIVTRNNSSNQLSSLEND
jgi:hypothetical protein